METTLRSRISNHTKSKEQPTVRIQPEPNKKSIS